MSLTISPEAPYSERSANTLVRLAQRLRIGGLAWSLSLFGVFLLALGLRLNCLDCYGFWGDEVASLRTVQRGLAAIFADRFGGDLVHTSFHYLLVWFSTQAADPVSTSLWARLPSAVAGALTPLIVYGVGRELFGRVQGLLAGLLTALSPAFISLSQDIRPYAMLTFLTTLSVYCLLMVERTRQGRWWAAFTLATAINLLNAYVGLTLVMPVIAPYLLWVLWSLWKHDGRNGRALLYAFVSVALVGLTALLMLLDGMQVLRRPPEPGRLGAIIFVSAPMELLTWLGQLGMESQFERLAQLGLLLLALIGLFIAVRNGRLRGAFLCGAMLVAPATMLAVLATTNIVFQRYALFVLPFYFLLISNSALSLASLHGSLRADHRGARVFRVVGGLIATVIVSLFAYGAIAHASGGVSNQVANRPDMRSVSRYLAQHAAEGDVAIYAGWGPEISRFYWKDEAPLPVYHLMDPLLFKQPVSGSLYWVVSYDFSLPPEMLTDPRWAEVHIFGRAAVLREHNQHGNILQSTSQFVADLNKIQPRDVGANHVLHILNGSIHQARGEINAAVDAYRAAGGYYPITDEILQTSEGFKVRGYPIQAWEQAIFGKDMQPHEPRVHRWMAELMAQNGYLRESAVERQIADALEVAR